MKDWKNIMRSTQILEILLRIEDQIFSFNSIRFLLETFYFSQEIEDQW